MATLIDADGFEVGRAYRCVSAVEIEEIDRIASSGPCEWRATLPPGAVFGILSQWSDAPKFAIQILLGTPILDPDSNHTDDYHIWNAERVRCVAIE
jgi:hypothetical protein